MKFAYKAKVRSQFIIPKVACERKSKLSKNYRKSLNISIQTVNEIIKSHLMLIKITKHDVHDLYKNMLRIVRLLVSI